MSTGLRHRRTQEELGTNRPGEALRGFSARIAGPAIGFCYRVTDARWFRLSPDGTAYGPDGEPMDLTDVFELRAFTTTHELRWLHSSAGYGQALLISDTPVTGAAAAASATHSGDAAGGTTSESTGPWRRDTEYQRLLWGKADIPASNGWLWLRDTRIGLLPVPVDDQPKAAPPNQVWLSAVEYTQEDRYGNVTVVDERLTRLVVRPVTSGSKNEESGR